MCDNGAVKKNTFTFVFATCWVFQTMLWALPAVSGLKKMHVPTSPLIQRHFILYAWCGRIGNLCLLLVSWIVYVQMWDDAERHLHWNRRTFSVTSVSVVQNAGLLLTLVWHVNPENVVQTAWFQLCNGKLKCGNLAAAYPVGIMFDAMQDPSCSGNITRQLKYNAVAMALVAILATAIAFCWAIMLAILLRLLFGSPEVAPVVAAAPMQPLPLVYFQVPPAYSPARSPAPSYTEAAAPNEHIALPLQARDDDVREQASVHVIIQEDQM